MLGRIGKTYPRVSIAEQTRAVPAWPVGRFGALGGLIALLSALGVAGWLIFRSGVRPMQNSLTVF